MVKDPLERRRRGGRARTSVFKVKEFAWELQDLMDIPREVLYSKGGFRYEKPTHAQKAIRAIIKTLVEALLREETIYIRGFGTFKIEETPAKLVNRPFLAVSKDGVIEAQSKTNMPIGPKKRVVFIPSPHMEAMINPENPNALQRRSMKNWK